MVKEGENMADLRVNVAGVEFSNPLIAASGTFGFGREYNEFYPLSALGGISCKGITIKERPGNPPPRVTETPGGMLNAVGLQNLVWTTLSRKTCLGFLSRGPRSLLMWRETPLKTTVPPWKS